MFVIHGAVLEFVMYGWSSRQLGNGEVWQQWVYSWSLGGRGGVAGVDGAMGGLVSSITSRRQRHGPWSHNGEIAPRVFLRPVPLHPLSHYLDIVGSFVIYFAYSLPLPLPLLVFQFASQPPHLPLPLPLPLPVPLLTL